MLSENVLVVAALLLGTILAYYVALMVLSVFPGNMITW